MLLKSPRLHLNFEQLPKQYMVLGFGTWGVFKRYDPDFANCHASFITAAGEYCIRVHSRKMQIVSTVIGIIVHSDCYPHAGDSSLLQNTLQTPILRP